MLQWVLQLHAEGVFQAELVYLLPGISHMLSSYFSNNQVSPGDGYCSCNPIRLPWRILSFYAKSNINEDECIPSFGSWVLAAVVDSVVRLSCVCSMNGLWCCTARTASLTCKAGHLVLHGSSSFTQREWHSNTELHGLLVLL